MLPHGGSKGSRHCRLPAATRAGRSRGVEYIIEGAVGLAAKFEVQLSNLCWNTKMPLKGSHLHIKSVLEEANLPTIHGPLAVSEHMNVSGSMSLRGSVHRTETTGAPDTKKNSPAVKVFQDNMPGDQRQLQNEVVA